MVKHLRLLTTGAFTLLLWTKCTVNVTNWGKSLLKEEEEGYKWEWWEKDDIKRSQKR